MLQSVSRRFSQGQLPGGPLRGSALLLAGHLEPSDAAFLRFLLGCCCVAMSFFSFFEFDTVMPLKKKKEPRDAAQGLRLRRAERADLVLNE